MLKQHDSVAKFLTIIVMNWVTPKAAAKHELLFNQPASVADL